MPIYRGPGGSSPLNDNVTVTEVTELTLRAEDAAETAQGSVAETFQNAAAANQSKLEADQQRAFAQAAAQEASGYAVEAFESKQTAQQQATTATTQATQAIEAKDEAVASAEAARLSELAAAQAREDADQFSVVAQSQATTATLKAQEALESAQSSAGSAQSAADSAQSASDSEQAAFTSRIIAAGQANNAVNAANAAEQSETNAAQSAAEAAASAASVDADTIARIDQSNTFAGSQTISKNVGDVGLTIIADDDNDDEEDNAFLELSQDSGYTKGGISLSNTNSTVLSSFRGGGSVPFNAILFRQDNLDTQNKTMVLDPYGRVGVNTTSVTAQLTIRGDLEARVDPESDSSLTRLATFSTPPSSGRSQTQLSIVAPASNVVAITSGEGDTLKIGTNNPNDNSAFNEVMLLTPQGSVGIGTGNPTSKLHVGGNLTVDGNIINDSIVQIETGTWTPVFLDNGGGEVGGGVIQRNGEYVKVGTQVTVYFRYNTSSSAAASLTIERLTGLPFPVKDTVDNFAVGSVQTVNIQFGDSDPHLIAFNNTSTAFFRYNRSNATQALPTTPSNGGAFTIRGSLTYETN